MEKIKKEDEGTGASGPGSEVGFRKNAGAEVSTTTKKKKQQKGTDSGKSGNIVPKRKLIAVSLPIRAVVKTDRGEFRVTVPDVEVYTDE